MPYNNNNRDNQSIPFWDWVQSMSNTAGAGVDHASNFAQWAPPPPPEASAPHPVPPPFPFGGHGFGFGGHGFGFGDHGFGPRGFGHGPHGRGGRGRHGHRRDGSQEPEESPREERTDGEGEEEVEGVAREDSPAGGRRRRGHHGRRHGGEGEGEVEGEDREGSPSGGRRRRGPHGHAHAHGPHGPHGRGGRHGFGGFRGRRGPPFGTPGAPFDLSAILPALYNHPYAQAFRNYAEQAGLGRDGQRSGETLAPEDVENYFIPPIDLFSTEKEYILHVALPGAKKEDVGVNWDADKGTLNLAGVVYRQGDEEFLKTLTQAERKVGAFERTVRLPPANEEKEEVDGDSITAQLEYGVLVVRVPKVEKEWTEVKKVDII